MVGDGWWNSNSSNSYYFRVFLTKDNVVLSDTKLSSTEKQRHREVTDFWQQKQNPKDKQNTKAMKSET